MFIDKIKHGSWTAAAVIAITTFAAATATAQPSQHEEKVMERHIVPGESALKSRIVDFHDLDIETNTGARNLLWRVSSAASRLCGDSGRMDLKQWQFDRVPAHGVTDRPWSGVSGGAGLISAPRLAG